MECPGQGLKTSKCDNKYDGDESIKKGVLSEIKRRCHTSDYPWKKIPFALLPLVIYKQKSLIGKGVLVQMSWSDWTNVMVVVLMWMVSYI